MAIRTIITRGFGNGTFNGTVPLVVLHGYTSSTIVVTSFPLYIQEVKLIVPDISGTTVESNVYGTTVEPTIYQNPS